MGDWCNRSTGPLQGSGRGATPLSPTGKDNMDKKTKTMCIEVLSTIVDLCNTNKRIIIDPDFGGNSLTIHVYDYENGDNKHNHVGLPEDGFEQLIGKLHNILVSDTKWMLKRKGVE
jgi:hypothetical protein